VSIILSPEDSSLLLLLLRLLLLHSVTAKSEPLQESRKKTASFYADVTLC
jgi:hypothetical protein